MHESQEQENLVWARMSGELLSGYRFINKEEETFYGTGCWN